MRRGTRMVCALAIASAVPAVAVAEAMHFSAWTPAQKVDEIAGNSTELNTPSLDGCPIQSPDGLSLYMASNRPGGHGLLDIWVAHRESTDAPFGAPENLGDAGQLRGRRLLPDARPRGRALLREPEVDRRELRVG